MNITPYFKIRKQGFTLIELLVAAAIGMVTTMTAGHVLTTQNRCDSENQQKRESSE